MLSAHGKVVSVAGVAGAGAAWGLYFFFYERAKTRHASTVDGPLTSVHHMAAAFESGCATVLLTNPLWLIKTRLQLQIAASPSNYSGLWHALSTIVRSEGILGLYKGIVPALALTSHGAVQFVVYERLKAAAAARGISSVRRACGYLCWCNHLHSSCF